MSAALDELFAELKEPVDIVDDLGDALNCPQAEVLSSVWIHHGGPRMAMSSNKHLSNAHKNL
jgi:hypothetical protein